MSDYEPADMSCEEDNDEEEECDGVFVSPKAMAAPSPVVSGASNISEGDLSDIVSPTPSDLAKNQTTGTESEDGHLYSPSHPLESGEECVAEETQLPSPPPPPSQSFLTSATATPPPPSLQPPRELGDLPPWAAKSFGSNQYMELEEKENHHNTSEEKTDNEEAFADQMLEEQFSKSAVKRGSLVEGVSVWPQKVPGDDKQEKMGDSAEDTTAPRDKERKESEGDVAGSTGQCATSTSENQQTISSQRNSGFTDVGSTTEELSQTEEEEEMAESVADQQHTASSEENGSKYEKTKEDDRLQYSGKSPTSLPATKTGAKSEAVSARDEPKTRPKHRSASYREKTGHSEEDTVGGGSRSSSSSSSSPRRSMRQRERSEKGHTSSGLTTGTRHKSKTENSMESDVSHGSSSRGRHKYETRHRRRSEAEDESSGKEERRELRSRHKRRSDNDSGSERSDRRELRPRKGADRKEDEGDSKRSRSKRAREESQKSVKSRRDQSPTPTSGKRGEKTQSKLMVPTMQAFEDELNNYDSESIEKTESSNIQKKSIALKAVSVAINLTLPSKPRSEKKRTCEEVVEEATGDKEAEVKEDECYLRSLSLPPFKVAKTSPAGSPTDRQLSSSDSQTLSTRSISHSPPGSAVMKKKPTLTKDELLAMVRAKKKSSLPSKESPGETVDGSPSEQTVEIASGERVGMMTQSRLNMENLMVKFHRHMQARKGSDTSWIHPWTVPVDATSNPPRGVMIPIPRSSAYSLRNPPPPPPGPPPSATAVQPSRPLQSNSQQPLPTATEGDASQSGSRPHSEAVDVEEKNKPSDEEMFVDSTVEAAELQATEGTLMALFRDVVGRAVEERIRSEEIFQGRCMDTLENKVVQESVRKFVDTAVEEKVTELICAEDVLQERTLEAVEDRVSGEIVKFALEEGVGSKVVELIRAENVLQERVLDALESTIVNETVAELTDKELTKESKWLVQAEEILQEEAVKSMQKTVVSEMVHKAVSEQVEKKARETVKSEEFLQERAVSVVESRVVEQTVAENIRETVEELVLVEMQSELVEEATAAVEERLIEECEMSVAEEVVLQGEVGKLVVEGVLEWILEECEVAAARERVCMTEAMVDAAVSIAEKDTSEQLICGCEETLAVESATEEMLEKVAQRVEGGLIDLATDTVAEETVSEEIILEMDLLVTEELQCDLFYELQSQIAREMVEAEEKRQDLLVEKCLQVLEDAILSEISSVFASQLITEALTEIEEKVIQRVEEEVFQDILQDLVNDIIAFDMEIKTSEKLVEDAFSGVLGEVVGEVVEEEERVAGIMEGTVTCLMAEEMVEGMEDNLAKEQVNKEDDITLKTGEEVSQTVVTDLVKSTEEKVVAEMAEQKMTGELEEGASDRLVGLLLSELVDETASKHIESQEAVVSETGEVASQKVEEECVMEAETTVTKELAVAGEVQEMIFKEIEEEVSKEKVVQETVVGEVEEGVLDGIEREAAAQEAEAESKKSVCYEITEVFPDTSNTAQTPTLTHIHVMDTVEETREEENQIVYEVTEVVPDSVSPLKAVAHVHILESDLFTEGRPESGSSGLLSGSCDEPASTTYVHVIDTAEEANELANAETPDNAAPTHAGSPPSEELKPKPSTPEREESSQLGDSSMTSPVGGASVSPPQLSVLSPLLPKYISRRLQLLPIKFFSPPGGVQRPTPLPPAPSSSQTADETPPSGQEFLQDDTAEIASVAPRGRRGVKRRGWPRSTRARRRNSSGSRPISTSLRELRPRTRSQSCSSAPATATTTTSPTSPGITPSPGSPLVAPSPSHLNELVFSSIRVADEYSTTSTPPEAPAPTRRRGRRGRRPRSSRFRSRASVPRRKSRSAAGRSEDVQRPPTPPMQKSFSTYLPPVEKPSPSPPPPMQASALPPMQASPLPPMQKPSPSPPPPMQKSSPTYLPPMQKLSFSPPPMQASLIVYVPQAADMERSSLQTLVEESAMEGSLAREEMEEDNDNNDGNPENDDVFMDTGCSEPSQMQPSLESIQERSTVAPEDPDSGKDVELKEMSADKVSPEHSLQSHLQPSAVATENLGNSKDVEVEVAAEEDSSNLSLDSNKQGSTETTENLDGSKAVESLEVTSDRESPKPTLESNMQKATENSDGGKDVESQEVAGSPKPTLESNMQKATENSDGGKDVESQEVAGSPKPTLESNMQKATENSDSGKDVESQEVAGSPKPTLESNMQKATENSDGSKDVESQEVSISSKPTLDSALQQTMATTEDTNHSEDVEMREMTSEGAGMAVASPQVKPVVTKEPTSSLSTETVATEQPVEEDAAGISQSTVKPEDDTAGISQSTVKPEDDTAGISQSMVEPEDDTAGISQSTVKPEDDTAGISQSMVEPEDDTAGISQSAVEHEDDAAGISQSAVEPEDDTAGISQSAVEHEDDAAGISQSAVEHEDDAAGISQSMVEPEDDAAGISQSAVEHEDDTAGISQSMVKPEDDTAGISQSAVEPKDDTAGISQSMVKSEDDTTGISQSMVEPEDDTAGISQSTVESKHDTTGISQSMEKPEDDTAGISQSMVKSEDDTTGISQSTAEPEDDTTGISQSMVEPEDDTAGINQSTVKPEDDTTGISQSMVKPEDDAAGINQSMVEPEETTTEITPPAVEDEKEDAAVISQSMVEPCKEDFSRTMEPNKEDAAEMVATHREDSAGNGPQAGDTCQPPQLDSDVGSGCASELGTSDNCSPRAADKDEKEHSRGFDTEAMSEAKPEAVTESMTEDEALVLEDSTRVSDSTVETSCNLPTESLTEEKASTSLATESLTKDATTLAIESCTSLTTQSLTEDKASASTSLATEPLALEISTSTTTECLNGDKPLPLETGSTTMNDSLTEERSRDLECLTNDSKNGNSFRDAPLTLDLSSIDLDSPRGSPATGVSSSPTTPHSVDSEDMVLRLEASFSSAPETDSDMEEETDVIIIGDEREPEEPESQPDPPGKLDESGEKAIVSHQETEASAMEWGASIGDSSPTKPPADSGSVTNPTTSPNCSEEKTDNTPPEEGNASQPSPMPVELEDTLTLVSEESKQANNLGGVSATDAVETVTPSSPAVSPLPPTSSLPHTCLETTSSLLPTSPPSSPPPPPPPPPVPRRSDFDDSRPPWAMVALTSKGGEGRGEPMDLASESDDLSSSEEPKRRPYHPFLVINTTDDENHVPLAASVPVSSSTDSASHPEGEGTSTRPILPPSQVPLPSSSIREGDKEEVTFTLAQKSSHSSMLNISKDSTTATTSTRLSPASQEKTLTPVSEQDLMAVLSSANQEFSSAPLPREKSKSKTPSPSKVLQSAPVTQLQPVGTIEGSLVSSRESTSRETTPEASNWKAKQRLGSDSLWQSFSDCRPTRANSPMSFSEIKASHASPLALPLPLPLPLPGQMSHPVVAGRGGGGGMGRVPRPHPHSIPGLHPYQWPNICSYSPRNHHLHSPPIYPHPPPQLEHVGLLPYPPRPLTPPPHYSMPHPPPLPPGPYSPPPPHPFPFLPGAPPPSHPPTTPRLPSHPSMTPRLPSHPSTTPRLPSHPPTTPRLPSHPPTTPRPYGHFIDPRHRYRSPSRYRSPFNY